jgi:hypothetical protein
MHIQQVTKDDQHEVTQWYKAHKWPTIDFSALPPTGLIVPGVCAGWLYLTDSPTAILEWVISNPKSTQRDEGLNLLLKTLEGIARHKGYRNIFTGTKHSKLVRRLMIDHNYLLADENVTHLMKIL